MCSLRGKCISGQLRCLATHCPTTQDNTSPLPTSRRPGPDPHPFPTAHPALYQPLSRQRAQESISSGASWHPSPPAPLAAGSPHPTCPTPPSQLAPSPLWCTPFFRTTLRTSFMVRMHGGGSACVEAGAHAWGGSACVEVGAQGSIGGLGALAWCMVVRKYGQMGGQADREAGLLQLGSLLVQCALYHAGYTVLRCVPMCTSLMPLHPLALTFQTPTAPPLLHPPHPHPGPSRCGGLPVLPASPHTLAEACQARHHDPRWAGHDPARGSAPSCAGQHVAAGADLG